MICYMKSCKHYKLTTCTSDFKGDFTCFEEYNPTPQPEQPEAVLTAIIENKEICVFGKPRDQDDADEPRYEVLIIGPERLMRRLINLF